MCTLLAQLPLFAPQAGSIVMDHQCFVLEGVLRERAEELIRENHYAHSVPSGKSHYFQAGEATLIFAIPANNNIGKFLVGKNVPVWELSRLWAPNGHERNLLTWAISEAVRLLKQMEPKVAALVSYADPNVGHEGFVYRAASWHYCGQCEESRYYRDASGQVVARRKFHSGSKCLKKAEIEALGYQELKLPGKQRFAIGLKAWAKAAIRKRFPIVPGTKDKPST